MSEKDINICVLSERRHVIASNTNDGSIRDVALRMFGLWMGRKAGFEEDKRRDYAAFIAACADKVDNPNVIVEMAHDELASRLPDHDMPSKAEIRSVLVNCGYEFAE